MLSSREATFHDLGVPADVRDPVSLGPADLTLNAVDGDKVWLIEGVSETVPASARARLVALDGRELRSFPVPAEAFPAPSMWAAELLHQGRRRVRPGRARLPRQRGRRAAIATGELVGAVESAVLVFTCDETAASCGIDLRGPSGSLIRRLDVEQTWTPAFGATVSGSDDGRIALVTQQSSRERRHRGDHPLRAERWNHRNDGGHRLHLIRGPAGCPMMRGSSARATGGSSGSTRPATAGLWMTSPGCRCSQKECSRSRPSSLIRRSPPRPPARRAPPTGRRATRWPTSSTCRPDLAGRSGLSSGRPGPGDLNGRAERRGRHPPVRRRVSGSYGQRGAGRERGAEPQPEARWLSPWSRTVEGSCRRRAVPGHPRGRSRFASVVHNGARIGPQVCPPQGDETCRSRRSR